MNARMNAIRRLTNPLKHWSRARSSSARGVAMAEFSLVLPIFIVLVVGLMEFAITFNALLGVNFASRDAALIAAEAGTNVWADCVVLQTVDDRITAPADRQRIDEVRIYRSDVHGNELAANTYSRGGITECPLPDGTMMQVNFSLLNANYPVNTRCNTLAGCPGGRNLDTIGVSIQYDHSWITPIAGLVTLTGDGFEFTRSNAMRMEPIL